MDNKIKLALNAQTMEAIKGKMTDAMESGDRDAMVAAQMEMAQHIAETVENEFNEVSAHADAAILAQRGVRQLTAEETKYYNKMIDAMKSVDPKQAVTLIDDVMPTTVIDEVFKYLTESHPLLDAIAFQNTGAITQWIMSTSSGVAGWGDLCGEIDDELSGAFSVIELGKNKLSAFIPVCNAMLDLGPAWLDRYVRTLLAEAIAVGLETAIVDGDGKGKPLGMTRKLSGDSGGVFPRKAATKITALDQATYGTLLDTLSQAPNNKRRAVDSVLLVVNPKDYFVKVFPATTPRTTDGGFNSGVFPFPTRVVQSAAVPEGYAVMGLAERYFMGLGGGIGRSGRIEYSDEYKFLEDQRMYKIKLYGNGRAMDENAFVYLDITGLTPYVQEVVVNEIKGTVKTKEQA